MIILGITGGSGCGKTTVSSIFKEYGVDIIDCDIVSRKIVKKDAPALLEIKNEFGDDYLNSDGTLNRKKLGALIFTDPCMMKKLDNITHKYIIDYIQSYIEKSNSEIIAIDGATLIESGIYKLCDYLISVLSDEIYRQNRISKRDNITLEDAKKRIKSQKNDDFYIDKSHFIIYNNDSIKDVRVEILNILDKIRSQD